MLSVNFLWSNVFTSTFFVWGANLFLFFLGVAILGKEFSNIARRVLFDSCVLGTSVLLFFWMLMFLCYLLPASSVLAGMFFSYGVSNILGIGAFVWYTKHASKHYK